MLSIPELLRSRELAPDTRDKLLNFIMGASGGPFPIFPCALI